jgi:hypothetical protein
LLSRWECHCIPLGGMGLPLRDQLVRRKNKANGRCPWQQLPVHHHTSKGDGMETGEGGISRRRMLRRIGAGAAVVWTAPVLSSLRVPAFAQQASVPVCAVGCGPNCIDPNLCGSDANGDCHCIVPVEGGCFCVSNTGCGSACDTPSDCPQGSRCVPDTCCGKICQPACGAPKSRQQVRGSRPQR